jgi:hypothetical protein
MSKPHVLAQQERVERRQLVDRLEHGHVAREVREVAAQLLEDVEPADLGDEQRAAAEAKVRALERDDQLGRGVADAVERLALGIAQAVAHDDRAVEAGGGEERGVLVLRDAGVAGGERGEIQDTAGRRGPFQAAQTAECPIRSLAHKHPRASRGSQLGRGRHRREDSRIRACRLC